MGFHKRRLKKSNIILQKENIIRYLSADAILISDDFSYNVYKLYSEGKSEEEIIKYINENQDED
jgi:cytochrome c-type biogenesis protein CcmH/NrfF